MPLTDVEKADLRKFLGYTDLDRGQYSNVEGAMNAVSAEGEAQLRVLLADLAMIEDLLRKAWKHQKAVKVEQVTLAGADEIINLRREGNRMCSNCASILGLRVAVWYFTESGGTANQRNTGYVYRG